MDNDFEIYKGKKFSDLCKDIYKNSNEKKNQIDIVIGELRPLITGVNEALMVVPLIKEYFDVGVRNDDALIKLLSVVQRYASGMVSAKSSSGNGMLTDQEKKQLLDAVQVSVKDVQANLSGVSKQLKTIDIKTEAVIDDVKEIVSEEK